MTKITKAACCLHKYLRICEMHNAFIANPDTLIEKIMKEMSYQVIGDQVVHLMLYKLYSTLGATRTLVLHQNLGHHDGLYDYV